MKTENGALLLDAREAAKMCGIGRTLWIKLTNTGGNPEPVRIGRRVLWRRDDLVRWIESGCPSRLSLHKMRNGRNGRR